MTERLNHQAELSLRPIEDSFHSVGNKLLLKWPGEARHISFPPGGGTLRQAPPGSWVQQTPPMEPPTTSINPNSFILSRQRHQGGPHERRAGESKKTNTVTQEKMCNKCSSPTHKSIFSIYHNIHPNM